jgi:deazaflavin-dependent oxidoreductase (nitroreductase family)
MAPPNNRMMIKTMTSLHRFWYRLTGGRLGGSFGKAQILLLSTTGRKSGKERTLPLIYVEDGANLALVASNGGDDRHPAWYLNLMANPSATVTIKSESRKVTAETAGPEDRSRLWAKAAAVYASYDEYTKRTSREIPVVILKPAA